MIVVKTFISPPFHEFNTSNDHGASSEERQTQGTHILVRRALAVSDSSRQASRYGGHPGHHVWQLAVDP
jgi:hypothetical protein